MIKQFDSLYDLFDSFPDEQAAIDHFRAIRWGENDENAHCPHCGSLKVYHFKDGRNHKCGDCRKRFSIKVGTIFEDTKIPLRKWFAAIWMITSHKKGIASTQLAKDIKVTQKTAWFMLHRLREASKTKSFNAPLDGEIEMDETYVGGRESNKPKSKRKSGHQGGKGKTAVFGMLERGGELRAQKVKSVTSKIIKTIVSENVSENANIMTDDHSGYKILDSNYKRHSVNHSAGEYVRHYFIHTNGIEGAWSLFKRQVNGIHHWISEKHMDRYLGEMCYRYNRREMGEGERINDLLSRTDGRLTYKALVA